MSRHRDIQPTGSCLIILVAALTIVPTAFAADSTWTTKEHFLSAVRKGQTLALSRSGDKNKLIGTVSNILANDYQTPIDERCRSDAESYIYDAMYFLMIYRVENRALASSTHSVDLMRTWCSDPQTNKPQPWVVSFEALLRDYDRALIDYLESELSKATSEGEAEEKRRQKEVEQKLDALDANARSITKQEFLWAATQGFIVYPDGGTVIDVISRLLADEYHTPVTSRCERSAHLMENAVATLVRHMRQGETYEHVTTVLDELRGCNTGPRSDQPDPFVSSFEAFLYEFKIALAENLIMDRTRKGIALVRQRKEAEDEQSRSKIAADKQAQERAKRADDLKSGRVQVADYSDAVALHEATKSNDPIQRPLLKPDNKYYAFSGTLERQEDDPPSLLGKLSLLYLLTGETTMDYFLLLVDGNTQYGGAALRLRDCVKVVGQYVENTDYKTVIGEQKTMAVFRTAYIEAGCK